MSSYAKPLIERMVQQLTPPSAGRDASKKTYLTSSSSHPLSIEDVRKMLHECSVQYHLEKKPGLARVKPETSRT